MSDVKVERSQNADGEAVFTATVPIPAGVDPDRFREYVERALAYELLMLTRMAVPDEFDDDETCDFTEEDLCT